MRRATTLLELIVALALGAALLVAVFAFLGDLLSTRERIRTGATRQASIAALFDRLDADLAMAIAADARGGAGSSGVVGGPSSLALLTRGVLVDPTSGPAALRDLQRTEYRFERDAHRLSARRSAATTAASGEWFDFDGEIEALRFRYHDGENWLETFHSAAAGGLPVAVEVSVWFVPSAAVDAAEATRDGAVDGADVATIDEPANARAEIGADTPELPRRPPDRRRVIAVPDARPTTKAARAAAEVPS